MKTCERGLHQYEGRRCLECRRQIYNKNYRAKDVNRAKAFLRGSKQKAIAGGYSPCLASVDGVVREIEKHKCAYCNRPEPDSGYRFPIDHCHATGRLRGLLCFKHNILLVSILELKGLIEWAESAIKG